MGRPTFTSPMARALKTPVAATPSTPQSRDKVLTGRIRKLGSPAATRLSNAHNDSSQLDEIEREQEENRYEEMMREKDLFPGSEEWAEDEERLFQILFMRQYSPLLPSHWGMDFRGIPVPDILFATSDQDEPVVYAHSDNGDFKATKAIIRLIDLTASVRSFVQMKKNYQVPNHMKKELDNYLRWAARDGGYDKRNVLTNIIVDVADLSLPGDKIIAYMRGRMMDLARQHRNFWRIKDEPEEPSQDTEALSLLPMPHKKPRVDEEEGDEDPNKVQYVEQPPVLYGLFVVNTTLIVVTVDPAKGNKGTVSLQVEVNFNKINQGVWNAITVAILVCLARDEMIRRKEHFELRKEDSDDDPDA